MTHVDQFESIFRAAVKPVYHYSEMAFKKILVISDLKTKEAEVFFTQVQGFLNAIKIDQKQKWVLVKGSDFKTTSDLLTVVKKQKPDLICTYRNLHSMAWQHPHSLGEHLDVLIQKTEVPVVILPHPHAKRQKDHAMIDTNNVMAITDHMSADDRLVNYAVSMTENKATLQLVHMEDTATYNRYIDAISKIPDIDTERAKIEIKAQLLKEPTEYIQSCAGVLKQQDIPVKIKSIVRFGHSVLEFQKQIKKKKIDLLVMHGKDEGQLAMHGVAYPLAIEIREIPLLII